MNLAQQLKEECQALDKKSQEAFKHIYLEEIKPTMLSNFLRGSLMTCYLTGKLVEEYGISATMFKLLCEAEGFSCRVFTEKWPNGNDTNYIVTIED